MVGRGLGSLLAAAVALGCCAPAALADESLRMVMVEHSPAMIEALEGKGYDVGFVGELNEAGVYVDDAAEAALRAEGYKIGATVENEDTRLAVKAQMSDTAEAEAVPGVRAVLTYADAPDVAFSTARHELRADDPDDTYVLDRTVRFVGQRVAAVVADSLAAALAGNGPGGGRNSRAGELGRSFLYRSP